MIATLLFSYLLFGSAVPFAADAGPADPAAQRADTAAIVGRVIDVQDGLPVPRAIVALYSLVEPVSVLVDRVRTGDDGHFAFASLPQGRWRVRALKQGFSSRRAQLDVTAEDGQLVQGITLALAPFAVASGIVSDDLGQPVVGTAVHAWRRSSLGRWAAPATTNTDDRGAYRLAGLEAGEYIVGVVSTQVTFLRGQAAAAAFATVGVAGQTATASRDLVQAVDVVPRPAIWRNGRFEVYPTVYYPSAHTPPAAALVPVRPGEVRSGIDLTVAPVPSVHVSGQLSAGGGLSPAGREVRIVRSDAGGLPEDLDVARAISDEAGRFLFPFVPQGEYAIRVIEAPAPGAASAAGVGATAWSDVPVSVGDEPVDAIVVPLNRGLRISGRVQFDGAAPLPDADAWRRARVLISRADGRTMPFLPGRFDDQGGFQTPELPGGAYILTARIPGPWRLRSADVDGRDVADVPLPVFDADVGGVLLTMSDRLPSLSGIVRDRAGRPVEGALVICYPADARMRSTGEYQFSRRVNTTAALRNGEYALPDLPAGEYLVFAAGPDELTEDSLTLDLLGTRSRDAVATSLSEGTNQRLDLVIADGALAPATSVDRSPEEMQRVGTGPFVDESVQARQAPQPGSGSIAGRALAGDTGEPLRGVLVRLEGPDGVIDLAQTDIDGQFVFARLEPGRYRLVASKAAYLTVAHGAAVAGRPGSSVSLGDGDHVTVGFAMVRGAVLTGTVVDEVGLPLPSVEVRALGLRYPSGRPELNAADGSGPPLSVTDDRGRYRIYGLPPGEYVVGVTAGIGGAGVPGRELTAQEIALVRQAFEGRFPTSRSTPADEPSQDENDAPRRLVYAPTFHPASRTVLGARQVEVGAGEERNGIDVTMVLSLSVEFAGRVLTSAGAPARGARVTIAPAGPYIPVTMASIGPGGTAGSLGGHATAVTTAQGEFRIRSLTSGDYQVHVIGETDGIIEWARTSLTLQDTDMTDQSLHLQPGVSVSGRLVIDSARDAPAFSAAEVPAVELRPVVAVPSAVKTVTATVDDAGRFVLSGVVPGEYVVALAASARWTLVSARAGNTDVLDVPFDVVPGRNEDQVILGVTDRISVLRGTFADPSGRPATDYYLIVVPKDQRHWTPGSRRIRATRPSADGEFSFLGLPPGDYVLAALWDVVDDEWTQPAFLETVVATGLDVSLAVGEDRTLQIRAGGH